MGGTTATLLDVRLMVDAAVRLQAKEIYFVHNHPSGILKPSDADRRLLMKIREGFKPFGISTHAIILNLNTGHYCTFDTAAGGDTVSTKILVDAPGHKEVSLYSFSEREFLKSPFDMPAIKSSCHVATLLSQERFGWGDKRGYLFLNTGNYVIGNFFATKRELNLSLREVAFLASHCGATQVIAYNNEFSDTSVKYYNDLKKGLLNLDIYLLDAVSVKRSQMVMDTYESYRSLANEGLIKENRPDYGPSAIIGGENHAKKSRYRRVQRRF